MTGATNTLAGVQRILSDFTPPLPDRRCRALISAAIDLERAFAHIGDIVAVGIIGGTGVGKSTLINALAGEAITEAGVRRPTSDSVVVYQHRDTAFASQLEPDKIEIEKRLHNSEDLRRVVLLDLPDFDSIEEKHKRMLRQVLPHVDLSLLVADPNKYADDVFYKLLQKTKLACSNRIVIFNKTDLLDTSYGEDSEEVLADLLEDFGCKLKPLWKEGEPQIFPISASGAFKCKKAGTEVPDTFRTLEKLLSGLRQEKLRRRIKHRNLDAAFEELKQSIKNTLKESRAAEKLSVCEDELKSNVNDLNAYGETLVTSTFTPKVFDSLKRYLTAQALRSWSAPSQFIARTCKLTATGQIPENSILNEKLNLFSQRLDRAVHRLSRTYESSWGQKSPQPAKKTRLAWNLQEKIASLAQSAKRKRFYWVVAAGLAAFAFFAMRPAFQGLLEGVEQGAGFPGLGKDFLFSALKGLLGYLRPAVLLSWVVLFIAAYIAVVIISVLRVEGTASGNITELADMLRGELKETVRTQTDPFREMNEAIRNRMDELTSLLE